MPNNLLEKYLTEKNGSPLKFTFNLMDNQIEDFMNLLKMETPPSFEGDFKKILKQSMMFKKSIRDFVKRITMPIGRR